MRRIAVPLSEGRSHEIWVGSPLERVGREVSRLVPGRRALIVSTAPVFRRHGARLLKGLKRAGFAARVARVPDGEQHKTLDNVRWLYTEALRAGLDRRSPVVALGGGVVGDMAGFLAASYLRGVPFVQVPTTLLAMVDASVGGKTGVDLPEGKNLVGAFWPPCWVSMDVTTLQTLPDRQWRTGMAEVIKYGILSDPALFQLLETWDLKSLRENAKRLEDLIARSAAIKADVVARDERETRGLRESLNLGHTFGHAIESVTGYRDYTHGEAVAVGLAAAVRLSAFRGGMSPADVARVDGVLDRWGLPRRAHHPLPRKKILAAMARDKKSLAGRFRFVVPERFGQVATVGDVDPAVLSRVLDAVGV